jgi:hypothetical protein
MTRPHGYARYRLDGCRCYTCAYARSEYDTHRNQQIAYGRWQPFTDLTLVQEHIAVLNNIGYGDRQIATLTGLDRKTIRDIRTGTRHDPGRNNPALTKIRTATAAAVLAIPTITDQAADHTYIDATLTWQRIHQLLELGHTKTWIAQHAGLGRAIQLGHGKVTARNARRIQQLHLEVTESQPKPRRPWIRPVTIIDELEQTSPPEHQTHRGYVIAEVEHLLTGQIPAQQIADQLGYANPKSLARILQRAGRQDLASRIIRVSA